MILARLSGVLVYGEPNQTASHSVFLDLTPDNRERIGYFASYSRLWQQYRELAVLF